MQPLLGITDAQLLAPVQKMRYKLEIYTGPNVPGPDPTCESESDNPADWKDISPWLKSISISVGGPGTTPSPIAGTWNAELNNEGGRFHPYNALSAYKDWLRIGREVRVSVGADYGGTVYYWQRLIGFMDAPQFQLGTQSVSISGMDYMKFLADTELRSPDNYWGSSITISTIATIQELGAEIYAEADAMATAGEADDVTNWSILSNATFVSIAEVGGGSSWVGKLQKDITGPPGSVINNNIGPLELGKTYAVSFRYKRVGTAAELICGIYKTGTTTLWGQVGGLTSTTWATGSFQFTAPETDAGRMRFTIKSAGSLSDYFYIDQISIKEITGNGINAVYTLPDASNGPYYVTLNGNEIWFANGIEGWYYDEATRVISFDAEKVLAAGVDLEVWYYTTQLVEDVVADILVTANLYGSRASALCDMGYPSTGVSVGRVWFDAGTTALTAIQSLCERVNYRFWFSHDGRPCFQPAPRETVPVFSFSDSHSGDLQDIGDYQDIDAVWNRVVIEGLERGMYSIPGEKQSNRWSGEREEATSIATYTEKTRTITNNLFQDQASVNDMCERLIEEFSFPRWSANLRLAFNPVPLELGDTISWRIYNTPMTGIVRAVSISDGQTNYKCEIGYTGESGSASATPPAPWPEPGSGGVEPETGLIPDIGSGSDVWPPGGGCYWTKVGNDIYYHDGIVGIRTMTDDVRDAELQWAVGAADVTKYTMGVDDSDADAWLLCSGDILTSTASLVNIDYDGHLGIVDIGGSNQHRIKTHLSNNTLAHVSHFHVPPGAGDDETDSPRGICSDGTYYYIADTGNHRIKKHRISDGLFMWAVGGPGSGTGDDEFNHPFDLCADGTYLYITDRDNKRIKKHLCSTGAYDSKLGAPGTALGEFLQPSGICTDGTYLYITEGSPGAAPLLKKHLCANLAGVDQISADGHLDATNCLAICTDGLTLFLTNMNNGTLAAIFRYTLALVYVSEYGTNGTGNAQFDTPYGICTDGTHLYIADQLNNRIKKHLLSDYDYVSEESGPGDVGFSVPRGICTSGTFFYRGPILKAGLDGSYCDSYPLFRARDGFQLMEDGTVGATDYIGLYAPAAITASYSLTFPGTGPSEDSYFAVSAAGAISWAHVADLGSTHNHDASYISIIGVPAANHFPYQTAGGELIDSGYDAADFAAAVHAHVQADITGLHVDDSPTFAGLGLTGFSGVLWASGGIIYDGGILGDLADVYFPSGEPDVGDVLTYESGGWTSIPPVGSSLGLGSLADPGADRMVFWDDGVGTLEWLACGNSVAINGTILDTIQDLRITASPQFETAMLSDLGAGFVPYGSFPGLTSWLHRKRIDLPIPTANLTDFPLYVPIIADADIGAHCLATGYDIRFTAADGVTELDYERESFIVESGNEATGIFWVKTDIAMAGTYIWCYYGNAAATDGADPESVWDADFKAVYHMNDATTSTILDSTGNNNDGTKKGANEPIEAVGKIAKGQDFDGTDDYIHLPNTGFPIGTAARTISAWIKTDDAVGTEYRLAVNIGNASQVNDAFQIYRHGSDLVGGQLLESGFFSDSSWKYISVTFEGNFGGRCSLYSQGALLQFGAKTFITTATGNYLGDDGYAECWEGLLDEVRISSIDRSAEWIAYEYANMDPADGGLTWGAEGDSSYLVDSPIYTDGTNVGINETVPAEKLDVDGNINVTGVFKVDDVQVVGPRVIDADLAYVPPTGATDLELAVAALINVIKTHGLGNDS